jgi:hypothetical protein
MAPIPVINAVKRMISASLIQQCRKFRLLPDKLNRSQPNSHGSMSRLAGSRSRNANSSKAFSVRRVKLGIP